MVLICTDSFDITQLFSKNREVRKPDQTFLKPSRRLFSAQTFWRLRYRMYALLISVILLPLLYASASSTPTEITTQALSSSGFEVKSENWLYKDIQRIKKTFVAPEIVKNPVVDKIICTQQGACKYLDKDGKDITTLLANLNLDYRSLQSFVELGLPAPVIQGTAPVQEVPRKKTLAELTPAPASPSRTSFLNYPSYSINAPILWSTLDDLFKKNSDGSCCNLQDPIDQNPTSSPIQTKLKEGIVHIAFQPLPGELGNSYIVGHSSNFSFIKSSYNSIFKPLEKKSKPGEFFTIWDQQGRELLFKVFETKEILEDDVSEAYKNYPDCRVVTLQTSILEWVNGQLLPTKRWLTRGELQLPNEQRGDCKL